MSIPAVPLFSDATRPVVVAAFGGWSDAGDASTGATDYLLEVGGADLLGRVDDDDFHDHQLLRPRIVHGDGGVRLQWPGATVARSRIAERELVVVAGPEPSFRWRAYCAALLELLAPLDPQGLIVLSSRLGPSPHTRPVPIDVTTTHAALHTRGVASFGHDGAAGIGMVLAEVCQDAGIPAVSVMATVPHYLSSEPNLSAALALTQAVAGLCDLPIPVESFTEAVRDELAEHDAEAAVDPDLGEFIADLERRSDALAQPDGIGQAVEAYLRRR